jgi:hypothetical protein
MVLEPFFICRGGGIDIIRGRRCESYVFFYEEHSQTRTILRKGNGNEEYH